MRMVLPLLLIIGPAVAAEPTLPLAGTPVPVAHRGLFKHAPENTIPAFAACLDLRLGFELDVRRSRDSQLVCVHDDTLHRTTNGTGKVADLSLRELRKLDAGRKFDPAFTGEQIPTLAEVFEVCRARKPGPPLVLLDLKVDDAELPKDLAKLVNEYGLRDRVVCIGLAITDAKLRERLKTADAKLPVAVLAETPDEFPNAIKEPNADWAYLRFIPTAQQVATAHQAGKRVLVVGKLFAGNEPANWKHAAAASVDAILTDYPLECRTTTRGETK